jgi:hypothetical protein
MNFLCPHIEVQHAIGGIRLLQPIPDTFGIEGQVIFKLNVQEVLNSFFRVSFKNRVIEVMNACCFVGSEINYFELSLA